MIGLKWSGREVGMFDYVTVEPQQYCRNCGAELNGWQSKDGNCTLDTIHFSFVNSFYTDCNVCHEWHEYRRKRAASIEEYELLPHGGVGV